MEKEKEELKTSKSKLQEPESSHNYENYYQHQNHSMKMAIAVVGGIIIISGVFFIGRASALHQIGERRLGKVMIDHQAPALESNQFRSGMAGKREGRMRGSLIGDVTKIDGSNITLKVGSKEYVVIISTDTIFTKSTEIAKQSDLKAGDQISVAGRPNSSGQINAIRIIITE